MRRWGLSAVIVLLCCSVPVAPLRSNMVQAAGALEAAKDTTGSLSPSDANVQHDVSFTLPRDAAQITPSDWIIIQMPTYLPTSPASGIIGAFGTPQSTIQGTTVYITNIALLPGTQIEITGIIASNPAVGVSTDETFIVASDQQATLIRNQASVQPSFGGAYISVSATIDSQMSSINLSGFTSPAAFTTLSENGTVIGTTSADGIGSFSFPLSGLNPGDHNFNISSADTQSRTTALTTITAYLPPGTLTSDTGILLSPSLQLDKTTLNQGDTLTASGSAKPNSQISLFTESPLKSYTAQTDSTGTWTYTLAAAETTSYQPGQYRTYGNVQDTQGNQSTTSLTLNFTVGVPINLNNPPPCGNISHGDLNCDGKTNLTDFSILLFYWHTNRRKADINSDGTVNLVDFSIMMYYFQR